MIKDNLTIGQKVILKRAMLNEPEGSVGYVFSEYQDFENPSKTGVQIIFQKGSYDGFSYEEQCLYLQPGRVDQRYSMYEFKNVNQVWRDYQNGYWEF